MPPPRNPGTGGGPSPAARGTQSVRGSALVMALSLAFALWAACAEAVAESGIPNVGEQAPRSIDYSSMLFVLVLATFVGLGVVARVSRLLHTPLMSLTNAISAIAVVGSIIVAGSDYPFAIRILGVIALFASMTNIVSGFLITDRMLKMFKQHEEPRK
jgi:NAD(P) transhydrogenase subunit alpha